MRVTPLFTRRLVGSLLLLALLDGCAANVRRFPEGGPQLGSIQRPSVPTYRPPHDPAQVDSLVAFILKTNRRLDPALAERIAKAMAREAAAHGLDVRIVAAMIAHESSFNHRAVSSSGAIGLGQLLPATAKWLGVQDSYDPDQNVAGVCLYLKRLCAMWPGPDWERVLASYRLGQGTISRALASSGRIPEVGLSYARSILAMAERLPVRVAASAPYGRLESGLQEQQLDPQSWPVAEHQHAFTGL